MTEFHQEKPFKLSLNLSTKLLRLMMTGIWSDKPIMVLFIRG